VCESDDNDSKSQAYWGQSALNLEAAWQDSLNYQRIAGLSTPACENLRKADLTQSFRFDDRLASILHSFVYKEMPLTGKSHDATSIHVLEVEAKAHPNYADPNFADRRFKRINLGEVEAVKRLVGQLELLDGESAAVLTPYVNQASAIRRALRRAGLLEKVEVLNTHRAQGREWDVVVFSAVDGSLPRCYPWYTDSTRPHGVLVLNTTLSRVRRKLYLVVERGFWRSRPNQLLGTLVSIAERREVPPEDDNDRGSG
jgi:superfamily I DNA/RNA helicase